jgi:hypothetical protein
VDSAWEQKKLEASQCRALTVHALPADLAEKVKASNEKSVA